MATGSCSRASSSRTRRRARRRSVVARLRYSRSLSVVASPRGSPGSVGAASRVGSADIELVLQQVEQLVVGRGREVVVGPGAAVVDTRPTGSGLRGGRVPLAPSRGESEQALRDAVALGAVVAVHRRRHGVQGVLEAVELGVEARRTRFPAGQVVVEALGQRVGGGVVEHERGGQRGPGRGAQPVAQLHRGQRVEPELGERPLGRDRGGTRVAQDRGDVAADQVEQGRAALAGRQRREPGGEPGAGRARGGRLVGCRGAPPDGGATREVAPQGRQRSGGRLRPQGPDVEGERDEDGVVGLRCGGRRGQRGVEQGQRVGGGEPEHAAACHPVDVAGVEPAGQPAAVVPQAPGQRHDGAPAVGTVAQPPDDGVDGHVGGGVVGLPGGTGDARAGGEHHEGAQVVGGGELVQRQQRVELRAQDPVEVLGGQRGEDAVVGPARGVHDGADRVGRRDGGQGRAQRVAVGDVARHEVGAGAGLPQVVEQSGGRRGGGTPAPEQQQVARAVGLDQVPGHESAERARGPRDDDGASGVDGLVDGEHDPVRPGLLEPAQGLLGVVQGPGPHRRNRRVARFAVDELGEQARDALGTGGLGGL
ncbi:collagen alpha-2(I) chain-like, partial [Herrania umbratica]|uniref:Collagen alpha-2(I) chain-like n=1 Tax=Herrania umbratica TaxID=108875 RepID=A0A6J1BLZ4_9ROSI